MAILEIFHLGTNHTFRITRGRPMPFYPNLIQTKLDRTGQAYATIQDPTWAKSRKPETYQSWEDLMAAPPPEADLRATRRGMIVELDNPFPITPKPEIQPEEKQGFLSALMAEFDQYAENLSTRRDSSDVVLRFGLIGLVSVIALVAMVMAFIVVQNVWTTPPVPPV